MGVVRVSRSAESDLREAAGYINQESTSDAAAGFVRKLLDTVALLSDHPLAGAKAHPAFGSRTRKFPSSGYLIYYRPFEGGVEVLRILHGTRRQQAAFRSK